MVILVRILFMYSAVFRPGVERDPHPFGLAGAEPYRVVIGRPRIGEPPKEAHRGAVGLRVEGRLRRG